MRERGGGGEIEVAESGEVFVCVIVQLSGIVQLIVQLSGQFVNSSIKWIIYFFYKSNILLRFGLRWVYHCMLTIFLFIYFCY